MNSFLDGFKVLDLTDEKGYLCGRILGDFGADVIKIEPPGGDPARWTGPFYHNEVHPEKSLYWFFANANKRGITLDLKTSNGRDLFTQLVRGSDLVIESYPPGYMAELGLDYSFLAGIRQDIILTSISPFGQDSPDRHFKVSDMVAIAMGGMAYVFGDEDRAPVRISVPQAYFLGAQHAAVGSVLALYHKQITGEGQWVDTSMQEAIMFSLIYYLPLWEHRRLTRSRSGPYYKTPRPPPLSPLYARRLFHCLDGYVCLAIQGGNRAAINSSRALVSWANEEGYALELRDYDWDKWNADTADQSEQEFIEGQISPFLLTKTKNELLVEAAKRKMLLAPVSTAADLPQNAQLIARKFWTRVNHPELDDVLTYPGLPFKIEGLEPEIYQRAPMIGEHNREIFQDEMGLTTQKIAVLKSQGVI
jgi:crotonobetainyl-CoA:carnitine CoA-transferase CaiB-like acyl-CoA transferase